MTNKYAQIIRSLETNKSFSYRKGNIALNFSLNIDNLDQVIPFKACLEQALADVEEIIKSLQK